MKKDLRDVVVVKKGGARHQWDADKIAKAIIKASSRAEEKLTPGQIENTIELVQDRVLELINVNESSVISTALLHELVLAGLFETNKSVYQAYKSYREQIQKWANAMLNTKEATDEVVSNGKTENANKDSQLNSTKNTLIGEEVMNQLMKTFVLRPEWLKAHEEGWIHIHDLSQKYLKEINCCLFDAAAVMDGPMVNGVEYEKVKSANSAWNVLGDLTLNASAQQFGGFTLPEVDTVMAKYAEMTYQRELSEYLEDGFSQEKAEAKAEKRTIRELEQGYQGFETKLNTISNALGQVPFVTITMGLNTSKWGREVTRTILNTRMKGIGAKKITAIFPKIVMLYRSEIMGEGAKNEDLFDLGIECSATRMYPDWLSLEDVNNNFIGDVYERTGKAVSPMGCRAFLSDFYKEDGEEVYTGRMNIGAVSLNLPKFAIEAKGNKKKFFNLIDVYSQMAFDIHEDYYECVGKMKGSSNPLMWCEGGAWMSVGYDEPVAPIIQAATASLGYIGIEEVCHEFYGDSILNHKDFAVEIVQYLADKTVEAKKQYNHLYALYATPAESLCFRFNKMNKAQYGEIEGVTDREYMTNSFHIHVTEDVNALEKIDFESTFHGISTGGRISYTEFNYGVDFNVLKQTVRYAMSKGIYYGVNIVSSTCGTCGHQGDYHDVCPKCGSTDITEVERVCGYLSYGAIKGTTRFNPGKVAEVRDRVKHGLASLKRGDTIKH